MKYPQEQFEILVQALEQIQEKLPLKMWPTMQRMYFEVYQQMSAGHQHTSLQLCEKQ